MSYDAEHDDDDSTVICVDCGATLWAGNEWDYQLDDEHVLCRQCARRRGGWYDLEQHCWHPPPRVADLYRPIQW